MQAASPRRAAIEREAPRPVNETAKKASKPAKEESSGHASEALVERVRAGDGQAFRELFQLYNRRAYAVALGVVKNEQDALDVVQEAFIKVHKHIGSFQGSSSFYTWLYRIVMNLSIDHVRRARHVTDFDDRVGQRQSAAGEPLVPHFDGSNPGKSVARKELSRQIRQALDALPEYHRAVIMLREVEGLSYEEMARVLEVPKGTVMSRLFHARKKMQEALQGYLEGDLEIQE
jgi:RNA polymerase sigma-70 factor (ECF subfamily)